MRLTEFPSSACNVKNKLIENLQTYKTAFITEKVWHVLMAHLSSCVQKEPTERTKVHDSIIELILTLIRNIL